MWERHSVIQIGLSCIRMDNHAPAATGFPLCDEIGDDASRSPTSSLRGSPVTQPFILRNLSSHTVCIVLIFASTYVKMISADTFTLTPSTFDCRTSVICNGLARVYVGGRVIWNNPWYPSQVSPIGSLSLSPGPIPGEAVYVKPVRMLDPYARQSASFNTSFTIDSFQPGRTNLTYRGDGMTFVISAQAFWVNIGLFGMFDKLWKTPFKSIIVEFDTFHNPEEPVYDISDNHVSIDFANITAVVAANASDVDVHLWSSNQTSIFAWVEYSNETEQLEVRVSHINSRPTSPLLNCTVKLFDVVEEYMWVGFSSGDHAYNWNIRNWTFTSSLGFGSWTKDRSTGNRLSTILEASMGSFTFIIVCILIALIGRRIYAGKGGYRDSKVGLARFTIDNQLVQIDSMPQRFSSKELRIATKAFSKNSKLGEGGFGSVFRGVLPSCGTSVAVKKISGDSKQGEKEFMAEVSIISRLRHRNLINLLGWCKDASKGIYLLVYELMPNGSLDKALFGRDGKQTATLSWAQRFNIVTGTAAALDYLHRGWKQQVIHRDIKSSNIMLDEDWNAKLGDFGLARLVDHKMEASTTVVAGTRGYIAPEVAAGFAKFTDKADVFAFGAVVLEVACGRKALSFDVPEDEWILVDWVWHSLSEGVMMRTVDQRLKEYNTYWMEVMLTVGLLCSHPDPQFRPSMRQVFEMLAGDVAVPSIPLCKPTLMFSSIPRNISSDYSYSSETGSAPQSSTGQVVPLECMNTSLSSQECATSAFP